MPPSPDDPSLSGQEAVCAVVVSGGKAGLPVTPHASQARAAVCSPRLSHIIQHVSIAPHSRQILGGHPNRNQHPYA
jgi:hypothetical protein